MNGPAIKKYFESQYRGNRTLFVTRLEPDSPEWFLISDGYIMLLQSIMSPVLESRALFPKLPDKDQSFSYKIHEGLSEKGTNIINIWKNTIEGSNIPADISAWCHGNGVISRVFILQDGRHVFIQERFLALLTEKKKGPTDYTFYARNPVSPVIVQDGESHKPCAVFLPFRVFPAPDYLTPPQPEVGQA